MNLYNYYNNPEQLQGYQTAIITMPDMAYYHANNVLKGPFPEGEKAIATNAEYSYSYAVHVLKGPFPKGEPAITNEPAYSYLYALIFTSLCEQYIKR
ncbi:MAG: hypothetical protein ACXW2E_00615 [Nitrososphaeraceae archaeon]